MSQRAQSFENHAKLVPAYHGAATLLLLVPTLWFAYRAATDFSVDALMFVLFCGGVVTAALFARLFPLGVQDRVIRLEERMRLERLLPEDLQSRVGDLTTDQLIGLRFAPDEELPGLTRSVLDGSLSDRTSIKQAVKNWHADHQRI
jgi:uncharacterized membrane protein YciS (DUF1049 family)